MMRKGIPDKAYGMYKTGNKNSKNGIIGLKSVNSSFNYQKIVLRTRKNKRLELLPFGYLISKLVPRRNILLPDSPSV